MAVKVIFLTTTGASTWTVPADWTTNNKVEVIGGGGGGRTASVGGGGGGGGAYSSVSNIATLTVSQVVNVAVGAGGAAGATGGDTWFGATTLAASLVGAKGGAGATSATGAAGGLNTSGFPTSGGVRNSGGAGGLGNTVAAVETGGGGGGAGGPGGAGGLGGAGDTTAAIADNGGGGGSGAGTSTAGGAGGAGTSLAGAGGTNANGGGPGGDGGAGAGATPTAATTMWVSTAGPGASTGGGGGGAGSTTGAPGSGSNYGGGGGGAGTTISGVSNGAKGLIVITYTQVLAVTGAQTTSATTQTSSITVPAGAALFMRPSSDASTGGWTNEAGGTALFASLDETSASDSDYIQSGLAPAADVAEVHLSDPTGALASATLRFRIGKAVNDATVINIMAALVQGAMVIASWTYADVAFGYTLKTETLTAPQLAVITDANDLRIRFTADSPSGVSAEFQQFLDRAGTIAEPYYTAYGNLIDGIVAAGAWADIEALGVFAAPNQTTALINVKAAGTFTKAGEVGAGIVFTAGEGFTNADASNNGAISTGVIPASASLYARNSAHIGIYKSAGGALSNDDHGWLNGSATVGGYISFNESSRKRCNIHSNFSTDDLLEFPSLLPPAHLVGNRSGPSASELYARGNLVASDTVASLDISGGTFPIWIGARNFNGNKNQVAGGTYSVFHVGRSLSGAKVAALNTLIEAFLAAVP